MTHPEKKTEPTESRLIKMLELLRPTPEREQEAAARSRAKFINQAEKLFAPQVKSPLAWLTRRLAPKQFQPKEEPTMKMPNRRFAFTALATVIVLALLLFGGAGATAFAAQSALPGDALYSLKTGLEQTQISLSRSAYNRAQLQMEFAERRLDEVAALIGDGRFNDIGAAVVEFEGHIQAAIAELQAVAAGDPARAAELATQVTSALSRYALTLGGMLTSVPDDVRPEVERALLASQNGSFMVDEFDFIGTVIAITQQSWTVGEFTVAITLGTEIKDVIVVGDVVKVHAFEDANGVLTAREIELFTGEDNVNENANANSNDNDDDADDNMNENANDNDGNSNSNDNDDDDNANSNSNDNDDDDNSNSNSNDNDDDDNGNANSNDNDDDDDNDNSNLNSNTNQNSNDNDNENDNDNDNDNDNENDNDND